MPNKAELMKFEDMPYGTHFQENRRGGRKFIKLQDHLPSGLTQKSGRIVEQEDGTQSKLIECNAVDYDGIHASCPDWLEFKVIQLGKYVTRNLPHKAIDNIEKLA